MKTIAIIVALVAGNCVAQADKAVSLEKVSRYADGSAGAILVDATGRTPFHIGLSSYRCDLFVGATHGGDEKARRLQPGGEEEAQLVARLVAWSEASFDKAERQRVEAADDVHHRGSGWTFDRYKEAAVVNRLAQYRLIRGAKITDVIEGRGTVHLSFKVRDGLGRTQLVLWRSMADGIARPHLGDSMTPIAEGGLDERWVLQAMLAYSRTNVPKTCRDALWAGHKIKAENVTPAAMSVISILVEYKRATSPRITNVFHVKDGGSTVCALVDVRGAAFEVRFDKGIGSDTIGRMLYRKGDEKERLVAFGSEREQQLLAGFEACLRRGTKRAKHLRGLLDAYADLASAERGSAKKPATLERANCYRDGSVSGTLVDEHGRVLFCLAMDKSRCELFVGAMRPGHKDARRLEAGSSEEKAVVDRDRKSVV